MVALRSWLLRGLGIGVILGLGAALAVGSLLSRSTNSAVQAAKAPALDVRFKTVDGLTVAATYRPGSIPDAPAILLLHGNGGSRAAFVDEAAWLSQQGFATLALDFRGYGESSPSQHSFGLYEARDARAGFDWLKARQNGAKIGVIGSSLGGAASLIGDDGPLLADAFVLQAVYPDIRSAIRNRVSARLGKIVGTLGEPLLSYQSRFRLAVWPDRLAPVSAVALIKVPVFVIGGANDTSTLPDETRRVYAAVQAPKHLWIAPGLGHDETTIIHNEAYHARLLAFLSASLKAR